MASKTEPCPHNPEVIMLSGFTGDSIVDGPGLRCTVFCQGCPHGCPGCHNPATHPFTGGEPWPVEQLFQRIGQYPLCRAVTLSGGEPFCQAEALCLLAAKLREAGYTVDAYSGYTFEQLSAGTPAQQQLLGLLDTLVDGTYIEARRSLNLRFRGSENQRIIQVPQSLAAGHAILDTSERWNGPTP